MNKEKNIFKISLIFFSFFPLFLSHSGAQAPDFIDPSIPPAQAYGKESKKEDGYLAPIFFSSIGFGMGILVFYLYATKNQKRIWNKPSRKEEYEEKESQKALNEQSALAFLAQQYNIQNFNPDDFSWQEFKKLLDNKKEKKNDDADRLPDLNSFVKDGEKSNFPKNAFDQPGIYLAYTHKNNKKTIEYLLQEKEVAIKDSLDKKEDASDIKIIFVKCSYLLRGSYSRKENPDIFRYSHILFNPENKESSFKVFDYSAVRRLYNFKELSLKVFV